MKREVSLQVARNCMRMIRDGATTGAFEALGVNSEDFRLVCSDEPFLGADRGRVVRVLDSLTHGTLDVVGLPRIEVPAEFRASVISMFVHPGNLAVACRWCEAGVAADEIVAGGSIEPVSANELFALVCQLHDEAPSAQAMWRKRTGRAVDEADVIVGGKQENA